MKGDLVFEIANGRDMIRIQPIGQPHMDSVHSWDNNCIRTLLTVKGGAFEGKYKADIFTFEFEKIKQDLRSVYQDLSGGFTFHSRDHELELRIQGDGNGHFTIDCTAIDEPTFGAQLKFQVSFDQTYIPGLVKQLNDITRAFPIIGNEYNIANEY